MANARNHAADWHVNIPQTFSQLFCNRVTVLGAGLTTVRNRSFLAFAMSVRTQRKNEAQVTWFPMRLRRRKEPCNPTTLHGRGRGVLFAPVALRSGPNGSNDRAALTAALAFA
jgi:hypothetical protein